MTNVSSYSKSVEITASNIGGIDETRITISPGVTVLSGKNATNRTSFLQAIMAAMGSDQVSLKGDSQKGRVTVDIDGETRERILRRSQNTVEFSGSGWLDDPTVADLFAFLLENNEARRAVTYGDNLRDIIMRPVDTDAINREIQQLDEKKRKIDTELDRIDSRKQQLPSLEQQRDSLLDQISKKKQELSVKETAITESNQDLDESRSGRNRLDTKLDELGQTRSDLQEVRQNIESQQESISSLKQERSELKTELDDHPEVPVDDLQYLSEKIEQLRNQRQTLNSERSELQSLIEYNEDRLEAKDSSLVQSATTDTDSTSPDAVTDRLLSDDSNSIVCWTCGSTVEQDQIKRTIEQLKQTRTEKINQLKEVKSKLKEQKEQKREAKKKKSRLEKINQKLEEISSELSHREQQVAVHKRTRQELTDDIGQLEQEVEAVESKNFEHVLSLHKEANELEFAIDQLESDVEAVTEEVEEIETLIEKSDTLRAERKQVEQDHTDKRTKIDQIESSAVAEFNSHMDTILEILEYSNIERIWIDRVKRDVREGRQKIKQTVFELHVVRSTRNGSVYDDTVDHLSESEREVTGLIFALAGFLVHDLYETVPFMLLDSLEAIDSDRIAILIDYFADYAEFLVVALLPEDAQALDDEITRLSSIGSVQIG